MIIPFTKKNVTLQKCPLITDDKRMFYGFKYIIVNTLRFMS